MGAELCHTLKQFIDLMDWTKSLISLAPRAGFEPATNRLTELNQPKSPHTIYYQQYLHG